MKYLINDHRMLLWVSIVALATGRYWLGRAYPAEGRATWGEDNFRCPQSMDNSGLGGGLSTTSRASSCFDWNFPPPTFTKYTPKPHCPIAHHPLPIGFSSEDSLISRGEELQTMSSFATSLPHELRSELSISYSRISSLPRNFINKYKR